MGKIILCILFVSFIIFVIVGLFLTHSKLGTYIELKQSDCIVMTYEEICKLIDENKVGISYYTPRYSEYPELEILCRKDCYTYRIMPNTYKAYKQLIKDYKVNKELKNKIKKDKIKQDILRGE